MASAKKKPTTSKSTVTKKTTKAAPRKHSAKKTAVSRRFAAVSRIGLRPEETDFMTFRITRQTLYWMVLGAVVILFTVWLMKLQSDIQNLYDQIDANTAELSTM